MALVLALGTVSAAWSAPPPIVPAGRAPPDRVGRVARVAGAVSFHDADSDHWSAAAPNYPVTNGDAFWTEPGARADLQIGSDRILLAPSTELDVAGLDDHVFAASVPEGAVYLDVRTGAAGDAYAIKTPRGTVQIVTNGRYEIVAGDALHPTSVTVVDGAAQVTGETLSLQVGPRQTALVNGADPVAGSVGPITQDAFLSAALTEGRPRPAPVPPLVQLMTGSEDLLAEGRWQDTPQFGRVWYPPVPNGWAPYRDGHWAYVAPWGWTWIDDAAWGFAPFHYGRWAQVDGSWAWVPVAPDIGAELALDDAWPCYAPALVSFVDLGAAAAFGGAVGWLPLGPREPYYPPYSRDLPYVRRLNARDVVNVSIRIATLPAPGERRAVARFVNRRAIIVVPGAAMARSAPVAAALRPVTAQDLTRAEAVFRAPVTPTAATAGVTPAVAREFNFIPPARAAQAAIGPAIHLAVPRGDPAKPVAQDRRAIAPGIGSAPALQPVAVRPPGRPIRPADPARPVALVPPVRPLPAVQHPAFVMHAPPSAARLPQPAFQPPRPAPVRPPRPAGIPNQR